MKQKFSGSTVIKKKQIKGWHRAFIVLLWPSFFVFKGGENAKERETIQGLIKENKFRKEEKR